MSYGIQLFAIDIPLNISWQQILLHLLNFAILSLGLYLILYKPVKNFMAKRKEHYQKMSDEADDKLAHAKSMETDYQKRLEDAEAEIGQLKAAATREAEDIAATQLSDTQAKCDKLLADAKENAAVERDRILASANEEIAQTAILATEKLLASSAMAYDKFIDAVNKEQS